MFLLINYIFINMNINQQQKMQYPPSNALHNALLPSSISDLFQGFPYSMYPPYWPFQFFGQPDPLQFNRQNHFQCPHCRPVLCRSVKTQTYQTYEPQALIKEQKQASFLQIKDSVPEKGIQNPSPSEVKQEKSESVEIISSDSEKEQSLKEQEQSISNKSEVSNQVKGISFSQQELLKNMLKLYNISPASYQEQTGSLMGGNSLESQLVKFFHQKICTFKKSKQEMIKLIIRKTQRHYKAQYNCKRDDRFKKFGGFKSMNTIYLEKLFSDSHFVKSYLEVLNSFIDEFDEENNQKLKIFLQKINSSTNQQEFKTAMRVLDEKNKMPWPAFWVQKLKKVTLELKANYINGTVPTTMKTRKKLCM